MFTPPRDTDAKTTLSSVILVRLNKLKGNAKAPTVDVLRLGTLIGAITTFFKLHTYVRLYASIKYLLIFFFYDTQEDSNFLVDCSDDTHNHLVPKRKERLKIIIIVNKYWRGLYLSKDSLHKQKVIQTDHSLGIIFENTGI